MGKHQFPINRISLYPKAVVVVSSVNNRAEYGVTTIAWNGIVSSRPQVIAVSFLPDSFTRSCILESRDFVINVPDGRLWREVNYLGSISGPWSLKQGQYPQGLRNLTLSPSSLVRSPRIDEFYLNIECRMLQSVQLGLYDCILGEVLAMHGDDHCVLQDHPKGNIDHALVQPLFCFADQYWSAGQYLGLSTENKVHPHGSEH